MKISSKELPDGQTEITIIVSKEELKELAAPKNRTPDLPARNYTEVFDTTRYCATCTLTDEKHDIEALGDIHANLRAAAICGGLYRLHDGPC